MQDTSKACHKEVLIISDQGGGRGILRDRKNLEGISPIDQKNKPVLNSPIGYMSIVS